MDVGTVPELGVRRRLADGHRRQPEPQRDARPHLSRRGRRLLERRELLRPPDGGELHERLLRGKLPDRGRPDTTYLAASGGFFDRTAAANPFKDYSYVYVPYCTGDIHGGTVVTQLGTNTAHFVGYNNFTAYLERLVPTFPTVDRIVIAGSSGGGYGAVLNALQTQSAFGSVRVDVLDDSGTFMPADVNAEGNGNIPLAMTAWNLASIAPADCTTCVSDPSTLYGYWAKKFPTHRAGLLSYSQDSTLPSYYGISTAEFTTGLDEDLTQQFAPNANLKAFVVGAAGHVLFFDPTLTTEATVSPCRRGLTQMVTDDPTSGPRCSPPRSPDASSGRLRSGSLRRALSGCVRIGGEERLDSGS